MSDNLLIEAIKNSTQYPQSARGLLKLFAQVNIDNALTVTISEMMTLLHISRGVMFKSLRLLKKEGLITQEKKTYRLNPTKMKSLQDLYLAKQAFMEDNHKKAS